MISMFILVLILSSAVALAGSYLRGKTALKKKQQKLEEMTLAMDEISKKLRMSNCDDAEDCNESLCSSSREEVEVGSNYSPGQWNYRFHAPNKTLRDKKTGQQMLDGVEGKFICNDDDIQLITIRMWIAGSDESSAIQTSVSQRAAYAPPEE